MRTATLSILLALAVAAPGTSAAKHSKSKKSSSSASASSSTSKAEKKDPSAAAGDDGTAVRGGQEGKARDIELHTLYPEGPADDEDHAKERAPRAVGVDPNEPVADRGMVMDLVEKSMRRNQRTIDACKQEAHRATPKLSGSVVLALRVADHKVVSSSVKGDTMSDKRLDKCLLDAAAKWTFKVPQADFDWQVDIEPGP
jgi:hypothetical protein